MFDHEWEAIPTNLDDLQPGPELGGILACVDIDDVSPHDRITVLRAQQRQCSFDTAQLYRTMASIVDAMGIDDPRWATETAAAEIQCALNLTRRATETELAFALELQHRLPQVWDALFDGDIDVRRARTFSRCTTHLPDAVARLAVERVIEHAGTLTTGELKARLDREVIQADPGGARERYESAVRIRRLIVEPTSDGTANLLGLDLPPHRVTAISRKVNHLARSLKRDGEARTMDQLRADVYLDLLLGKATDTSGGGVHIRTDLDTVAGLAAHPGELEGYGPVIADIARQVTQEQEDTQWRWSVTDTQTGDLIVDGITKRRPSTALRRHVEARNTRCVFPGCRMPSVDCDLDHNKRWSDGGETSKCNLHPLCRHHHILKDQYTWTYQPLPNGNYEWTSKLGHTYTASGRSP